MSRPHRYAAHGSFVAPALGTPGARPVILGFIIVESLWRLGQQLLGLVLDQYDSEFAAAVMAGNTPVGLLINLGSFVILTAALALVLTRVHGRGLRSLLGPLGPLRSQGLRALLAIAALFAVTEFAFTGFQPGPEATLRPLADWLAMLGPALLVLMIQTSSEELFYRGYLQQQIAALMPHPAAWLILPNIAFALVHISPYTPLTDNLAYLVWAFFFGLAASDLTARAGNLGPALALHLANNAYAFLFYGTHRGPDSGFALVLYPPPDTSAPMHATPAVFTLPTDLVLLALTWGAARLAIRR
ncbi:CPBP family intramembrane glutamic endopeptidase [Alisedimentitalea sp. MJ-SS2]|uniref:CPBP family intramembrane glutamic endopeptidase n=1 Tax=Aliisedimentitalea sp. MJ-SS2 TaxID=3049795 RepID=UPI0029065077|nr:CPBP family intramembrane glutamic endopeptidase [Alisedimentitalea sp. MJ-SS2]MDU8929400.1 CPBP family intramembrane glutamic endopeptidase [Alisedimentitalea sp. MJ-SS2]